MIYTLRLTDGDVEAYIQRPSEIVKNIFLQGITQANETKQVYFERLFRLLTLGTQERSKQNLLLNY